jgi:protease-4
MRTVPHTPARRALLLTGLLLMLPPAALASRKVVRIVLDSPVLEAPPADAELAALFGEKPKTLRSLVETIRKAGEDANVAGLALVIDEPQVALAQVEELTRALRAFRAKGKKVYCYMDYAGNAGYALAAAGADHITIAETSTLWINGIHAEVSFYKGMLDKIGVQAQMLQCGAYKAAAEPFSRTEPSPEFTENINWLLDGIYERWVELIAQGRKLDPAQVRAAIDAAPLEAEPAREHGLVDAVSSFPEFRRMLHREFGEDVEIVKDLDKEKFKLDMSSPFAIFELFQKVMAEAQEKTTRAAVGLVYVEGGITTGKSEQDFFGGGGTAGSTTVRAALEKALRDENVKAVVMRVNSPGGSALGSDIIWEAATRLAREKPLVVSMGAVAGSGGYYVSIPGETIFAEATTITASIGVVGGKLIWKDLWEDKIGITTTEFERGRNAALFSMNRPWSEQERQWMLTWMNNTYEQFKGRIRSSRGERIKGDLEQMAGGRVFTGRQALERGLVDRIGGLQDAIEYAAGKAGLSKYDVVLVPKPKDLMQKLAELFGQEQEDEYELAPPAAARAMLHATPLSQDPLLRAALPLIRQLAPRQVRQLVAVLRNASIVNREHVGMFMPIELEIR